MSVTYRSWSPEYRAYYNMLTRCYNPKYKYAYRYSERGIIVCDRWREDRQAFYDDMCPVPFVGAQLDREDNDGDYTKGNCRWVTNVVNSQNSSATKLKEVQVNTIRLLEGRLTALLLSHIYGVTVMTIQHIWRRKTWRNIESVKSSELT